MSLADASFKISAGLKYYTGDLHLERNCWWQTEWDWFGSRRRVPRRRYFRSCPADSTCDIFIRAELSITLLSIAKVGIDLEYLFGFQILTIKMSVQYKWISWTGFYWETLCDLVLYTRSFRDYSQETSENENPVVHGCEWQEHWGYWSVGKIPLPNRWWTATSSPGISKAKGEAMRQCAKQKDVCKAVQCWRVPYNNGEFVATRMRALRITDNKGAPPGWAQDGMYMATWAVLVQFLMCLIVPCATGEPAKCDEDGTPVYAP